MNSLFYTKQQQKVFTEDLLEAFMKSGFEIVEKPYIDFALYGFRATYVRRYMLQQPSPFCQGVLTTILSVVGLPFGRQSQKMVILAAPKNINNEPIADPLKLRIHFDENGLPHVVQGSEQQSMATKTDGCDHQSTTEKVFNGNQSNQQLRASSSSSSSAQEPNYASSYRFAQDLTSYVSHIIELISPGLIELPTEMKLEILKKLNVDSIIKMSLVNSEFRSLIFQYGESLWRHLCWRDFNIRVINRMVHRSWMELYRDSYIVHQVEVCRKERALPGPPERPALPPAPYRLQIEWLPEVLELPFYPLDDAVDPNHNRLQLMLDLLPLRRADSLDSLS